MNAASVESFLPQTADAPSARSARRGSFDSTQPFETFLHAASAEQQPSPQRQRPENSSPQSEPNKPRETREARKSPEAQQPRRSQETRSTRQSDRPDCGPNRETQTADTAKQISAEIASPGLLETLPMQPQAAAAETSVHTEIPVQQTEQKVETIPVIIETDTPQTEVPQQIETQPEFATEIETAEAEQPIVELKPNAENTTDNNRPVETPDIETISSDRKPASIDTAREDAQETQDNVEVVEIREPSDVEPPPAPPAPDDTPGERQRFEAGSNTQINVELRQAENVRQAAPAQAVDTARATDSQVIDQVVRTATLLQNEGRSEIRVQLSPPELGTVRLQLSADRNQNIEARIVVERDDIRDLIQRNIEQLRNQLEAAGVSVGGFDVSTQHSDQSPADHTSDNNERFAWDGAGEQRPQDQSSRPLGINRSTSAGAIDYLV